MSIFPRIASLPRIHIATAILLALLTALSGGAWAYLHPNPTFPVYIFPKHASPVARSEPLPAQPAASPQSAFHSTATKLDPHEQSLLQTSIDAITSRQNFLRSEIRNIHSEEIYRSTHNADSASSDANLPIPSEPSPRIQALNQEVQKLEAQKALLAKRLEETKPPATNTGPASANEIPLAAKDSPSAAPAESGHWTSVAMPTTLIVVLIAIVATFVGSLYLLAASRRFRTIRSLAAFESVLPPEVLMLGSIAEIKA